MHKATPSVFVPEDVSWVHDSRYEREVACGYPNNLGSFTAAAHLASMAPARAVVSKISNVPEVAAFSRAREGVLDLCRVPRDAKPLRVDLLAAIRRTVPFDAYAWIITDPETWVGCAPLADVPCLPELPKLIRLKYITGVNRWTALRTTAATLVAATQGDLSRSRMWQELLRDYRVSDVASSIFRDRFGCWGFLDLWRIAPAPPFSGAEVDFLASVAQPVCAALRQSQALTFNDAQLGVAVPTGPVVLLLSPDIEVEAQTPQTQEYLRVLLPPDEPGRGPIPAAAYNVAAQLLANESGVDSHPPRARVHLAHGHWLTLRAARFTTQKRAHDPHVAVTIESASPQDRISLFVSAFGLTARETELLHHLTAGADTRDVARLMSVSEHTVQDHLKSIFVKTDVRGRRALLARVLGT
jgi:DNA-binding CsgD family transcriptional regulator